MENKRRFIILNKEDEKYCKKGATGYCKIESYRDKTNIKVFVQGLRPLNSSQIYEIYFNFIF